MPFDATAQAGSNFGRRRYLGRASGVRNRTRARLLDSRTWSDGAAEWPPGRRRRMRDPPPTRGTMAYHVNRVLGSIYAGLGLLAVLAALLVPAYLRSVDAAVVTHAGSRGPGLVAEAQQAARLDKLGTAVLLAQAAMTAEVPDATATLYAVQRLRGEQPVPAVWGGPNSLLRQVCCPPGEVPPVGDSVMEVLLPERARAAAARALGNSRRADVQEVLKARAWRETALYPPVGSASGQAFEAAVLLTGLLLQAEAFHPTLRQQIEELAATANRTGDTARFELWCLNLTSLAKRMSWDQLLAFMAGVRDLEAARTLARVVTAKPADLPVVFAALQLAARPDAVSDYLRRLPQTGVRDLRHGLAAGRAGLNLLLDRGQPVYYAGWRDWVLAVPGADVAYGWIVALAAQSTLLALLLKYLLWLDGAFFIARAIPHFAPPPNPLERPLEVRGIRTLRQQTVAGMVVMLALILGEPGLARAQTPVPEPTLWLFSKQKPAMVAQTAPSVPQAMSSNPANWLALAVFFAVQMTVYLIGLIKLREIKRQPLPSRLKIKLLDNEENLFDTGLYIGLGGTGFALVLLALNLFTASPMIAYASTGFGVLFASLLKIIHVRTYRRTLILQAAQEAAAEPATP
jgi:hypothetical protein